FNLKDAPAAPMNTPAASLASADSTFQGKQARFAEYASKNDRDANRRPQNTQSQSRGDQLAGNAVHAGGQWGSFDSAAGKGIGVTNCLGAVELASGTGGREKTPTRVAAFVDGADWIGTLESPNRPQATSSFVSRYAIASTPPPQTVELSHAGLDVQA